MPDAGLADGSVLTSANYDTYLRQQVVAQVTSGTRPTGVEGRIITETDTDRIVAYDGSSWVRVGNYSSTGRTGVALARISTSQTISSSAGTFTAISWDTETTDTDAFITVPATTITIPSGLAGLYSVLATVSWNASPGTDSSIEVYNTVTTGIYRFPIGGGSQLTSVALAAVVPAAAGDGLQIRVSQGSGSSKTITATCEVWRLTP